MNAQPAPAHHPWSEESLFAKAVVYAERMDDCTADEWEHGFWSALCLEVLARAALAHISPVLLAEGKEWRNVNYALGRAFTAKKFTPACVGTKEVFARLNELVTEFTTEIIGFCSQHTDRRNAELHTGELAFASVGTTQWLPRFYHACSVLLTSMGKELSDLFEDATSAKAQIDSLKDESARAVQKDVQAHVLVWAAKNDKERGESLGQATMWATRQAGHRVNCPACGCPALLQGSPSGAVSTQVTDDEVIQRQTVHPSSFECIACGLRVTGLSKLTGCGLGDAYTVTSKYSAAEFFGLHTEEDLEEAVRGSYQEDFNEY